MKVMTIVGTRPEIIRLSRVMAALDRHVEHMHRAYRAELRLRTEQIFFEDLEIRKPDHFLGAAGATAARDDRARSSPESMRCWREVRPDAVLILGDTNSCLAANPAKRRKIPVFHMEAGNRCFDQRVPEEINRKIVDHISDINLPYSAHLARISAARGLAAGPGDQDRQPDVRSAAPLPAEDRRRRTCWRGSDLSRNRSISSSAPTARRTSMTRTQFAKLMRDAERPGGRLRPARDRLHASADAQADGGGGGAASPAWSSC